MADIKIYPYYSPRIVEVLSPDTEISLQDLHDKICDWEDSDDNSTYDEIIESAGKEALGGGVYVGITSTLQDAYVMFTGRTTPLETGTCTTGDTEGTTLYASGGQFEAHNVDVGDTVMNYTTKALANVIEVVSDTELKTLQLSGGARTTWLLGDEYIIWKNQQCDISGGNLVAVDSNGSDMSPVLPSPNVQVVRTASSSATLQELEDVQFASFTGGQVYLDTVDGNDENRGNAEYPVKTLERAKEVLLDRGLDRIRVIGSLTLEATDDIQNIFINGEAPNKTYIYVTEGCLTNQAHFNNVAVEGVLTGSDADFAGCYISDVSGVVGIAQNCWLTGTITLGGTSSEIVTFTNCYLGTTAVGLVTIDMNGDGPALAMRPYTGGVKVTNKSGSAKVAIDFISGRLELTDSVTAGTFFIRGVGEITSNEATGIILNDDSLINKNVVDDVLSDSHGDGSWEVTTDSVWDEVRSAHTGPGTFGAVDEWAGSVDTGAIADAVWDEPRSGHTSADSFGATDEWSGGEINVSTIVDAVWSKVLPGNVTALNALAFLTNIEQGSWEISAEGGGMLIIKDKQDNIVAKYPLFDSSGARTSDPTRAIRRGKNQV